MGVKSMMITQLEGKMKKGEVEATTWILFLAQEGYKFVEKDFHLVNL